MTVDQAIERVRKTRDLKVDHAIQSIPEKLVEHNGHYIQAVDSKELCSDYYSQTSQCLRYSFPVSSPWFRFTNTIDTIKSLQWSVVKEGIMVTLNHKWNSESRKLLK